VSQSLPPGVYAAAGDVAARATGADVLLVIEHVIDAMGLQDEVSPRQVSMERIGEGQSNLTYLLDSPAGRFVVRRPPPPPYEQSAHDVLREARIIQALATTAVPVPEVLAVGTEGPGSPFYVTNFLPGDVITSKTPARYRDETSRTAIADAMVDALIEVHRVDPDVVPLRSAASQVNYLERQLDRYGRIWEATKVREVSDLDAVGEELLRLRPSGGPGVLVHGDFRLGNIMWSQGQRPHVQAVLDWELASIGDPLADLAYFLTTYPDPSDPSDVLLDMSGAVQKGGYPDRAALAVRYATGTGADLSPLPWYEAFVRWRAAIGLESIYQRTKRGTMESNAWTASLHDGVPDLASKARRSLAQVTA